MRLPIPRRRRKRMKAGMSTTTTAKARRMPWTMDSPFMAAAVMPGSRAGRARLAGRGRAHETVDEHVECGTTRGLDEDDVAVAQVSQERCQGCIAIGGQGHARAAHATIAGAIGDAGSIGAHDDEEVRDRGGVGADTMVLGGRIGAEL